MDRRSPPAMLGWLKDFSNVAKSADSDLGLPAEEGLAVMERKVASSCLQIHSH